MRTRDANGMANGVDPDLGLHVCSDILVPISRTFAVSGFQITLKQSGLQKLLHINIKAKDKCANTWTYDKQFQNDH